MSAANSRNVPSMPRRRKPIVDCGSDGPAADRRLSRAMMARDQENEAIASRYRPLQPDVDGLPCAVEA
jgi:hypothetical protein